MLLLTLLCAVGLAAAKTECVWAMGELKCMQNQTRVRNTVVEIWDKDGPRNIPFLDHLFPDDKAGLTVVDDENGHFKVEGCASDFDFFGPVYVNRPEFYFVIRHNCRSNRLEQMIVYPPDMQVFVPNVMDHFMESPIILDLD